MTEPVKPPRKRLSALQLLGLFTLVALGGGFVVGFIEGYTGAGSSPTVLSVGSLVVLFAFAIGVTILYWRRLDEAAREAHKFAWYWGGSGGLLVAFAGAMLVMQGDAARFIWPGWDPSPTAYLFTGAMAVLTAQVVGYIITWIGWWLWNSRS